ncbi:type IV pilus modification protein PilV [Zhongshania sp.]|uniref:type IV pilus modification protein PilV n=1 Tax=Zhongshania sp. TaxID=1971902 RepID=UPI00356A1287
MNRRFQSGVSLIEVLIAVLITATGVLGASALQLNSVKFNQLANVRSTAVFLANDITDRMRANRAKALIGAYDLAIDAEAPTGDTITEVDLREWLSELAQRLPGGDGGISRNGNALTVTVQWDESRMAKSRIIGDGDIQSFVFVTEF